MTNREVQDIVRAINYVGDELRELNRTLEEYRINVPDSDVHPDIQKTIWRQISV